MIRASLGMMERWLGSRQAHLENAYNLAFQANARREHLCSADHARLIISGSRPGYDVISSELSTTWWILIFLPPEHSQKSIGISSDVIRWYLHVLITGFDIAQHSMCRTTFRSLHTSSDRTSSASTILAVVTMKAQNKDGR